MINGIHHPGSRNVLKSRFSIDRSKYEWFFRYKLYHLPFWFIYHYLSWALITGSLREAAIGIFNSPFPGKFYFYVFFQALGVYFNLYFLIPRFLEKGRYVQYIGLLILTILFTAACIVPGYYATAWMSDKSFQELFHRDPQDYMYFFKINALPSTIASMTLAMSVKLGKNWIQAKQREHRLEKEKLETELKFLKAQFNPHFLFNTINSIFVLINKNPQMASESLAKFSGLLRYQLYECNEQQIPLDQELTYLKNFIELEKLRQDGNVKMTIEIGHQMNSNLAVAPFIIVPFIENAIKHVSQFKDRENWIRMNLRFERDQLFLAISNSASLHNNVSNKLIPYNGIGLKNVQRRLDLLYPGKHDLTIKQSDDQFHVTLHLNLAEQKEPENETVQLA
jgi:two-component system, LytTR family, sensor kinase